MYLFCYLFCHYMKFFDRHTCIHSIQLIQQIIIIFNHPAKKSFLRYLHLKANDMLCLWLLKPAAQRGSVPFRRKSLPQGLVIIHGTERNSRPPEVGPLYSKLASYGHVCCIWKCLCMCCCFLDNDYARLLISRLAIALIGN